MTEDPALTLADRLWAIEQIKHLKSRYLQAVDEKDYGALRGIFSDDATVDFTGERQYHRGHHGVPFDDDGVPGDVLVGGDDTATAIREAVDAVVSVHHGHDPQIDVVDAVSATGRWALYDILDYGDEVMHGYGVYDERYRRVGEHWVISSLTLRRLRVVWESPTSR